MTEPSDIEISNALNVLTAVSEDYRFQQICKLSRLQKIKYKQLLDDFERLNKVSATDSNAPANLHNLK